MYAEWIEGLKVELQASGRGGNIGEPQCEERTVWVKERWTQRAGHCLVTLNSDHALIRQTGGGETILKKGEPRTSLRM